MSYRLLLITIAITMIPGDGALRAEALAIGQILPAAAAELILSTPEGERGTLAELTREHGLLVVFTANTCAYSVDWRDRIPRLAEHGTRHKIGLALVNSNARKRKADDSPEAMSETAEQHFPDVTYWIDKESKLADVLGASRTPEIFLFDAESQLVYHGVIDDHSGPFENVGQHFAQDAMESLVTGNEMPAATAPLGCAILRPRKRRQKP